MDNYPATAEPDESDPGWARCHDDAVTWNPDVRMGWLASNSTLSDERFYAVRNRDGKTVSARDRQGLIAAMAAADISRTLNDAFDSEPDPELPEELR